MAVGVPEIDVYAAADAVLARGERPTVERVRLELGRGSPARIGHLLETWWEQLARRLNAETRLPELPAEVSQAFVGIWQAAIAAARASVEQDIAARWRDLDAERERVAAVEDQARKDAAQFRQHAAEALAARQAAELRLADLELLLEQRQAQIEDLQSQREGLLHERGEVQQQIQALQADLLAQRQKAESERANQDIYVRGVEDRAHREVDRAREESKASQAQIRDVTRQLDKVRLRLETTQAELSQAQQLCASQQARGDTLEQQLVQLQLQLQLQLQKAAPKRKPVTRRKPVSKAEEGAAE